MQWLSITDATSKLLKFPSLLDVESYIQVAYLDYTYIQQSHF